MVRKWRNHLLIFLVPNLNKRRWECPKSRKLCCCPKQKYNRYARSVYQSGKKISYRSLAQRSWKEKAWHGFLKEVFKPKRMMFMQVVQQKQRRGDSRNNCQVGGLHQISKSLVMASSILSVYTYVEFIPWYAWLSLSSLFWSLVWIFMLWRVAKLFYLSMIKSQNILFRLCIFIWMNSYGWYFDITLSVKYSQLMLATIVLLESLHGIYFDGFKARGAWYMYFYFMGMTIWLIGL